jgi:hypothetical protein
MFRRRRKKQPTTVAPAAPDLPEVRDIASVALVQQIARGDLRIGPLPTGPDREAIVREEVLCAMAAGIVISRTWARELSDITDEAVAALSPDVGSNGVKPDRRLSELHQRLLDDLRRIANVAS